MTLRRDEPATSGQPVRDALTAAFHSGLLPDEGPVLVAVSGGQDSLALLHATIAAAPGGVDVQAVHVDHGMRPTSRSDARSVARVTRSLGVTALVKRFDVPRWLAKSHLNVEAAARSARYRLLAEAAQSLGGCPVLTGHTADDLVETVLLHVLRGAGLDGLASLPPRQVLPVSVFAPPPPQLAHITGDVTIVRPLLDVERWQTAAYCTEHGLSWITDETNEDVALTRNRIRHRLLPLLETYNPSIRRALRRLADLAREDVEVIEHVAQDAWRQMAALSPCSVTFPRTNLLEYERGVSTRLLRRAAQYLEPRTSLSYDQTQHCLNLAAAGVGTAQLSGTLSVKVSSKTVRFVRFEQSPAKEEAPGDRPRPESSRV
jgi:tRNA(Ile)-lysidine synthase